MTFGEMGSNIWHEYAGSLAQRWCISSSVRVIVRLIPRASSHLCTCIWGKWLMTILTIKRLADVAPEADQLRIEGHFGFRTFSTKFCNILKYGVIFKFETIVQIFRKIIQLNLAIILKSTNEYYRKFFSKSDHKMDFYPAMVAPIYQGMYIIWNKICVTRKWVLLFFCLIFTPSENVYCTSLV